MSKIVVVDDSYAELQLIEGYLKSANHTVVSYPNTDKLEDKLALDKPDQIVLDVVMPGRNGFQACRDLKSDDPVSYTHLAVRRTNHRRQRSCS